MGNNIDIHKQLEQEYNSLKGKYKHYCNDWDYLPIDETCHEFIACTCFSDDYKAQQIRDVLASLCARCGAHIEDCKCVDGPY